MDNQQNMDNQNNMDNQQNMDNQNLININLVDFKIICYDDNIIDGDNEHHMYLWIPCFKTIGSIKNKINQIWSPQLRGENYVLKIQDRYLNNLDNTLRDYYIENGSDIFIEKL